MKIIAKLPRGPKPAAITWPTPKNKYFTIRGMADLNTHVHMQTIRNVIANGLLRGYVVKVKNEKTSSGAGRPAAFYRQLF